MLSRLRNIAEATLLLAAMAVPFASQAVELSPEGSEFLLTEGFPGEQMNSSVAINESGGYIVWQDNDVTDGDGLGISAVILDGSFSATAAPIRINEMATGDQENAKVALLKDGGAVFVWQGGIVGSQDIYARFMTSGGFFSDSEIIVNTDQSSQKSSPRVAVLNNGNVVVIWTSYGQDGSLNGVYGQMFGPDGTRTGEEFQVNQISDFNQQTPSVAPLLNGGFVVTWTTEVFRGLTFEFDPDFGLIESTGALQATIFLLGRTYNSEGSPLRDEFGLVSGDPLIAHAEVIGTTDGGFAAAWSKKDLVNAGKSWDISYQAFNLEGVPSSPVRIINTHDSGDQVSPKLAAVGDDVAVVWTSLAQDGFGMGLFGQLISAQGQKLGEEFQVNTTWPGNQMQPALSGDGNGGVLVTWSGFMGGPRSFDVFGQRFSARDSLLRPDPPFVMAVSQNQINVSWPDILGFEVGQYELLIDGSSEPVIVSENSYSHQPLLPNSSHTYRLAYRLGNGARSPFSVEATGTSWGADSNFDGLPDDWQSREGHAGLLAPDDDTDFDGASNKQEFLAGTDPLDDSSVLRVTLEMSPGGLWFNWNTQPGFFYRVQSSQDLESWDNYGEIRFAADDTDAISINGSSSALYFRVVKIR